MSTLKGHHNVMSGQIRVRWSVKSVCNVILSPCGAPTLPCSWGSWLAINPLGVLRPSSLNL